MNNNENKLNYEKPDFKITGLEMGFKEEFIDELMGKISKESDRVSKIMNTGFHMDMENGKFIQKNTINLSNFEYFEDNSFLSNIQITRMSLLGVTHENISSCMSFLKPRKFSVDQSHEVLKGLYGGENRTSIVNSNDFNYNPVKTFRSEQVKDLIMRAANINVRADMLIDNDPVEKFDMNRLDEIISKARHSIENDTEPTKIPDHNTILDIGNSDIDNQIFYTCLLKEKDLKNYDELIDEWLKSQKEWEKIQVEIERELKKENKDSLFVEMILYREKTIKNLSEVLKSNKEIVKSVIPSELDDENAFEVLSSAIYALMSSAEIKVLSKDVYPKSELISSCRIIELTFDHQMYKMLIDYFNDNRSIKIPEKFIDGDLFIAIKNFVCVNLNIQYKLTYDKYEKFKAYKVNNKQIIRLVSRTPENGSQTNKDLYAETFFKLKRLLQVFGISQDTNSFIAKSYKIKNIREYIRNKNKVEIASETIDLLAELLHHLESEQSTEVNKNNMFMKNSISSSRIFISGITSSITYESIFEVDGLLRMDEKKLQRIYPDFYYYIYKVIDTDMTIQEFFNLLLLNKEIVYNIFNFSTRNLSESIIEKFQDSMIFISSKDKEEEIDLLEIPLIKFILSRLSIFIDTDLLLQHLSGYIDNSAKFIKNINSNKLVKSFFKFNENLIKKANTKDQVAKMQFEDHIGVSDSMEIE